MRRPILALALLAGATGCESLDGLSGGVRPDADASNADASDADAADGADGADAADAAVDADAEAGDAGPDPFGPLAPCRGEWCFVHPRPIGFALHGVWAESVDRFYAVGAGGSFLRWDKGVWSAYDTGGIATTFTDVDGTAADDLWIVGKSPATVLRFDGKKLVPQTAPTSADLVRVRARGPGDVWIARADGAPYRWTGSAFVPTPDGVPSSRAWYVAGLSLGPGASPSFGFAVGLLGFAARWDGTQWLELPAPFLLAPSQAVWAASADDAWSCVDYGTDARRWDGKAWSALAIGHRCKGIVARAKDDVWLVGNGVTHWNGVGVEAADTPLRTVDLRAAAAPVGGLVAVGGGGLALRRSGATWTRLAGGEGLAQLDPDPYWVSVLTLDGLDVWLTGRPRALRWDGGSASPVADAPLDLRGCHLRAKGDLFCAAAGGVARWNGGWTISTSTPFVEMVDVHGVGDELWAVGSGGQIRHWDGTKWGVEASGVVTGLRGVFARATEVWALGDGGVVLRREGGTWKAQASLPADLAHLARNGDRAMARLSTGAFVRFSGGSWVAMEAPAIKTTWIALAADGTAWAGGPAGVARWSGSAWATVAAPPIPALGGGLVGGKLWVVDETGVVVERAL